MYLKALIFLLALYSPFADAQTLAKEASNSFALYAKSKEFGQLEKAKKAVDAAYKTKQDSASLKINIVRAMTYSALANEDKKRKLSYLKDPLLEAEYSLKKINHPKFINDHQPEIAFCRKHIANAYLAIANRELLNLNYFRAYKAFSVADSLNSGIPAIKHNLALLSERMGNVAGACAYYNQLIADTAHVLPEHYLALSNLYERTGAYDRSLETLRKGNVQFPDNKDILFKEINTYADKGSYAEVVQLIGSALKMDPDNLDLYYLAGFSYENIGDILLAEKFYQQVIDMEPNNYDGNYALGLLYLNLNFKTKDPDALLKARLYLNKASEINPNAINALKSLSVLYKSTGDTAQLERVKNKLNQIILNY